jgi:hypothetical protein
MKKKPIERKKEIKNIFCKIFITCVQQVPAASGR